MQLQNVWSHDKTMHSCLDTRVVHLTPHNPMFYFLFYRQQIERCRLTVSSSGFVLRQTELFRRNLSPGEEVVVAGSRQAVGGACCATLMDSSGDVEFSPSAAGANLTQHTQTLGSYKVILLIHFNARVCVWMNLCV